MYVRSGEVYEEADVVSLVEPDNYYRLAGSVASYDELLTRISGDIRAQNKSVKIALDEWSPYSAERNLLGENIPNVPLADGLWAAAVMHVMHDHCEDVVMANWPLLLSRHSGVIWAEEHHALTTPVYWAFWLYSNHFGDERVSSSVTCETFQVPTDPWTEVPVLSASAAGRASDGALTLAVVNWDNKGPVKAALHLEGLSADRPVTVYEMAHTDPGAINTVDAPEKVRPKKSKLRAITETYTFPANSVTMFIAS